MTLAELETLLVRLIGDATSYTNMLMKAIADAAMAASAVQRSATKIESIGGALTSFGQAVVGSLSRALGIVDTLDIALKSVSLAAQTESDRIAFGVLMDDMQAGAKLTGKLLQLAAKTPLNLDDVSHGARLLLQYGIEANDIIPTLRMLGDVTGGNATRFRLMALAYGQVNQAGRLMGQDTLQMINAGFNPLMPMAKKMSAELGISVPEALKKLRKEQEKGLITFDEVRNAFIEVTGEGGKFHDMLSKLGKTTEGLFSTMRDDILMVLRSFGEFLIEGLNLKNVMAEVSKGAQAVQQWFASLSPQTKEVIALMAAGVIAVGVAAGFWYIFGGAILFTAGTILTFASTVGVVFGAILGVIGAVAAFATAVFVTAYGGIVPAWEAIKKFAVDAWNTISDVATRAFNDLYPVIMAFLGFATAMWEAIVKGAVAIWYFITAVVAQQVANWLEVLSFFFGPIITNWEQLKNATMEYFIFAEFLVRNFMTVMQLLWLNTIVGFNDFTGAFSHFFTVALPTFITWLYTNWTKLFGQMAVIATNVLSAIMEAVAKSAAAIPAAMAGQEVDWEAIWRPVGDAARKGLEQALQGVPNIPARVLTEAEKRAREERDNLSKTVGTDWAEFLKKRKEEIGAELAKPLPGAKEEDPAGLTKGIVKPAQEAQKEIRKLDAALWGSAEATARVSDYVEKLNEARNKGIEQQKAMQEAQAAALRAKQAGAQVPPGFVPPAGAPKPPALVPPPLIPPQPPAAPPAPAGGPPAAPPAPQARDALDIAGNLRDLAARARWALEQAAAAGGPPPGAQGGPAPQAPPPGAPVPPMPAGPARELWDVSGHLKDAGAKLKWAAEAAVAARQAEILAKQQMPPPGMPPQAPGAPPAPPGLGGPGGAALGGAASLVPVAPEPAPKPKPFDPRAAAGSPARNEQGDADATLKKILEELQKANRKPAVPVAPAGI